MEVAGGVHCQTDVPVVDEKAVISHGCNLVWRADNKLIGGSVDSRPRWSVFESKQAACALSSVIVDGVLLGDTVGLALGLELGE